MDGSPYCGRHGPGKKKGAMPKSAPMLRENLVCPHCQVSGHVVTRPVKVKSGMGGGALVGGVFLGVARRKSMTELSCRACGMTWRVG